MQLNALIEHAASIAGSEYKVAQDLKIPQNHISEWKAGTRTCSAEYRTLLADIAGVDPVPEIIQAVLDRSAGKAKSERIREVLERRLQSVGKS